MCIVTDKRRPVTPIQFSMNNGIINVVQYFNYLGINVRR